MDVPLPGYPQPFGSRNICIALHQGPTSYVTGGENVNANVFGFGSFDKVEGGTSFNNSTQGQYILRPQMPIAQAPQLTSGNSIQGQIPAGPAYVQLQWLTASNGTEVASNTNLTQQFARITYIGG
jgi:hypothetical protein